MTQFECLQCDLSHPMPPPEYAKEYVCPNCASRYKRNANGMWKYHDTLKSHTYVKTLEPGQSGILKGVTYTVQGVMVKSAYEGYHWVEYLLFNEQQERACLSVSQGNWIWLTPIEQFDDINYSKGKAEYQGTTYLKFDVCHPKLLTASGYFDFDVKDSYKLFEYIAPPHMLSIEEYDNRSEAYYGQHLSRSEVKKAFSPKVFPAKLGVGMVQPPWFHFWDAVLVYSVMALLVWGTYLWGTVFKKSQDIWHGQLDFLQQVNPNVTTPSFDLKGIAAPIHIQANTSIVNSWINLEVVLVNENTQEEVYSNKDVEYYTGYDGGEHWSEGSQDEDIQICGIPPGRYHLVLTAIKDEQSTEPIPIDIHVVQEPADAHNTWSLLGIGALLLIGTHVIHLYFLERARWEDSDYSPYDEVI